MSKNQRVCVNWPSRNLGLHKYVQNFFRHTIEILKFDVISHQLISDNKNTTINIILDIRIHPDAYWPTEMPGVSR